MSFQYKEVDPNNKANPEDFNKSIEDFGNFIGALEKAIKKAEYESDKEELQEVKDSLSDEVEVFETGGFTLKVILDSDKRIPIYKIVNYCNLEVSWIDFKDENLEIHLRDKEE